MRINSISFKNYRQFVNEKIFFSLDPNKHITVITGLNGAGKTTLVNAFIWCLYLVNNHDDNILLNMDTQKSMVVDDEKYAEVKIELVHNEITYNIATREFYRKNKDRHISVVPGKKASTSIMKMVNGECKMVPEDKVRYEINSILGSDLREYFFFDGEKNRIDIVSSKKNLQNSVSDLMGIKKIELLNSYFNPNSNDSVYQRLKGKLVSDDTLQLEDYQIKLSNLNNNIDTCNEEIESKKTEIEKLTTQKEEKEYLLENNISTQELEKKKKELLKERDNLLLKEEEKMKTVIRNLNLSSGLLKILYSYSFKKNKLEEKLSRSSFNGKDSLSHVSEEVIDQLICRGKCLCGTRIVEGSLIHKYLIESKEHMEPKNFGKYTSTFVEGENLCCTYSIDSYNNIIKISSDLLDIINDYDEKNEVLDEVKKELVGKPDIGVVQQDINNILKQIGKNELSIDFNNKQIISYEKEREQLNNKIYQITIGNEQNKLTNKMIAYADYIYKTSTSKINKLKKETKNLLEVQVNKLFTEMYHGNRKIVISDEFKAEAVLMDDSALDKSPGVETVKNYAFVGGLINIVKEKKKEEEYYEGNIDNIYPLVLDAPFSNTDDIHIKNICSVLPQYCEQIIIVVMEKDYLVAKSILEDKVGKKYSLIKIDESNTKIEED